MTGTKYHRIDLPDEESGNQVSDGDTRGFTFHLTLPTLKTVMAFGCGFVLAALLFEPFPFSRRHELDFLQPYGGKKVQFEFNDTYPGPPTKESEMAWLDLFPEGLGAIQHDSISDAIVTLGVFHQLHCLMVIRHVMWDQWNNTAHTHMTPRHFEHCLEYLRQAIMCNVDTNVETRTVSTSGTKQTLGWDVHRCRNFNQVKDWAQEWRAFDGKIPSDKMNLVDEDELHGRVIVY